MQLRKSLPQNFSSEQLRGTEQCANTFVNKKSNKLFSLAGKPKGESRRLLPERLCLLNEAEHQL